MAALIPFSAKIRFKLSFKIHLFWCFPHFQYKIAKNWDVLASLAQKVLVESHHIQFKSLFSSVIKTCVALKAFNFNFSLEISRERHKPSIIYVSFCFLIECQTQLRYLLVLVHTEWVAFNFLYFSSSGNILQMRKIFHTNVHRRSHRALILIIYKSQSK